MIESPSSSSSDYETDSLHIIQNTPRITQKMCFVTCDNEVTLRLRKTKPTQVDPPVKPSLSASFQDWEDYLECLWAHETGKEWTQKKARAFLSDEERACQGLDFLNNHGYLEKALDDNFITKEQYDIMKAKAKK